MAVETLDQNQRQSSQYIDFWNSVLVPKFIRWKHILVDADAAQRSNFSNFGSQAGR